MTNIALINMPFAAIHLPSIALTQLKCVVDRELPGRVTVNNYYLNHDIGEALGLETYQVIGSSVASTVSGLGDWVFREVAFPQDSAGESDRYRDRYLSQGQLNQSMVNQLVHARKKVEPLLEDLIDHYHLHTFDMVGFTSMFVQNMATFALARLLKNRNPNLLTVMGGANCEMSMGRIIAQNVSAIDFVFSGPALKSFPQFVRHVHNKELEACHRIPGVYSKRKLALRVMDSPEEIGEELDIDVDVPLDYRDYLGSLTSRWQNGAIQPSLLFETSRGCWWGERAHCTFCGLNGTTMQYRAMAPDKALKTFEHMFSYAPQVSRFESVDNILPRKYLTDVFPLVNPPENCSIFYEVKADLKTRDMEVLAKGGVTEIQPGIEALNTSTLKLMKKGTTSFQNIQFLQNCLVYGIKPVWNLLIGFPGETEDVYEKYFDDLPLLVHLPPPSGVYPVRFDRFSPYFTLAKEYGLKLKPYDFYSLLYPFDAKSLHEMAYFFEDQNYSAEYIRLVAKWLRKLQKRNDQWLSLWKKTKENGCPRLEYQTKDGREIVFDSRSGDSKDHQLDTVHLDLLRALSTPTTIPRLKKRVPHYKEEEIAFGVKHLQVQRLLFQENDQYMSLVVDSQRDRGSL